MKILVTGSSGYIGSALVAELASRELEATTCDLRSDPREDITSAEWRASVEPAPDLVYNLAGLSGEKACRDNGLLARNVNTMGALALRLKWPKAFFVQASSASCLADRGFKKTPYASSKRDAERMLLGFPRTLILRFATVFGVCPLPERTRWDLPLHKMVESAVEERRIVVYGPSLRRPLVHLDTLVAYLADLADDVDAGYVDGWAGPVPCAQWNTDLLGMAQMVASLYDTQVKQFGPVEDQRDYTMPALLGSPDFPEAELKELIAAAEAKRVQV